MCKIDSEIRVNHQFSKSLFEKTCEIHTDERMVIYKVKYGRSANQQER